MEHAANLGSWSRRVVHTYSMFSCLINIFNALQSAKLLTKLLCLMAVSDALEASYVSFRRYPLKICEVF